MRNNRGRFAILVVGAVVFLALGFVIGQVVQALGSMPGSADDPLVAQSYVQQLVGEKTAALQTQLEALQTELTTLKQAIGVSSSTVPDPSTGTNTGTTVSNPTKVEITASTVNIREKASTTATKIGSAVKGDILTYVATEGDWYKIKMANGTAGYVSASLGKLK